MPKNNVGSSDEGWCGYKLMVVVGVMVAIIMYTLGAVATGIAYRLTPHGENCTCFIRNDPVPVAVKTGEWFETPMVVVGPAFMAAGGSIVAFIIFQWCFCRPVIKHGDFS
ncbi:unnamed protein product [Meganyctiphanes norvegica]|uniref:Uncharacterized protein n=1 Tax=Meganyctiphanes norvegica TaxID=48144 RepID=A0AAV2S2U6_MEGNR